MAASESYLGNPLLKPTNVKIEYTKEQVAEYLRCSEDPIYFIQNYVKIVSLDEGLINFKMYPFQKKIVETIHKNRFTVAKCARQAGKSTTTTSYLLHQILFNASSNVAILANKANTAKDILDRLKLAYQNLPKWLQQGIVEWNKFSVSLENGSKIIAAATSSSAVRGGSYQILLLDEFAFVPNNIAENFFSSVYPTITSGKNTKVIIISTPKGLNHFYKIWTGAKRGLNGYVPVEANWNDVPGRGEKFKRETIANTSEQQWKSEFEGEFLGSENTLISSSKMAVMVHDEPKLITPDGVNIYEYPVKNRTYTLCADTARGMELDYHAFTVIDCTTMPYKIVASYRNNVISHQLYPHIIKKIATHYADAWVLFELNDLGQSSAEILHQELEYSNIIQITQRGKMGQRADGGFGGGTHKSQFGVTMSYHIKQQGCTILKDFIEGDKMIIPDFTTISELSTYVAKKKTFEASEGYHDDMVSTLVLFCWLTTQSFYKDYTNTDVRQRLYEEQIRKIDEAVMPFGFISDGLDPEDDGIDVFDERKIIDKQKSEFDLWKD